MRHWVFRAARSDISRWLNAARWPLATRDAVVEITHHMSPGDAIFFAVPGSNHDGEKREGYLGWSWVKTVVRDRKTGKYHVVLENTRLPLDTEGRMIIAHTASQFGADIRQVLEPADINAIKAALGWRRPEDEVTSSPLDGEIGESWGQSRGTSGNANWARKAGAEQRRAGRNNYLRSD